MHGVFVITISENYANLLFLISIFELIFNIFPARNMISLP